MQQVEDGVGVEGVPWLLKSPHALDGAGMRRDILKKKKNRRSFLLSGLGTVPKNGHV